MSTSPSVTEEAEAALRRAVALDVNSAQAHKKLSNLLVKMGRFEDAEAALRRSIALDDSLPWVHKALGNVLDQLGRTDEAVESAKLAVKTGPDIAKNHHQLGSLLSKSGRFAEAEAALRQSIALDGNVPWFHKNLGNLLVKMGRFEDAEAALRQSLALDDSLPSAHKALGNVLDQLGRTDEAVESAKLAVKAGPDIAELHYQLGNLLSKLGRFEEAEAAYKDAVTIGCRNFGFRTGLTDTSAPDAIDAGKNSRLVTKDASLHELLTLLAQLGSQFWAEDIEDLLSDQPQANDDDLEWPMGRMIPNYREISLPAGDPGRPEIPLSIMVPVHNVKRGHWLRECLESALAQDRGPKWAEIVVVDDASTNSTAKRVAESYEPRVTYRRNGKRLGLVGNHNHCIVSAKGEFVHVLHQDDYVEPGLYDALLEPMLRNKDIVAAFSNYRKVDEAGQPLNRAALLSSQAGPLENLQIELARQQRIQFSAIIVRRSAYVSVGGFSPSLCYSFDWDMWGRLATLGTIWYDPRALAKYRAHTDSATHGIAPLERLVDLFRTTARMVAVLPPDIRLQTARFAFNQALNKYWKALADNMLPTEDWGQGQLLNFLLRDWASDEEKTQLRTMLRHFIPRQHNLLS